MKCLTIASMKLPFECQRTTSMNPSQRQQTKSELSDQQQRLQKGEGPIRNKDLREKEDYDRRGSARGLTQPEVTNSIGVFRTMTSKTAAKERDQPETESNGDRGAKTGKCVNLERQDDE